LRELALPTVPGHRPRTTPVRCSRISGCMSVRRDRTCGSCQTRLQPVPDGLLPTSDGWVCIAPNLVMVVSRNTNQRVATCSDVCLVMILVPAERSIVEAAIRQGWPITWGQADYLPRTEFDDWLDCRLSGGDIEHHRSGSMFLNRGF